MGGDTDGTQGRGLGLPPSTTPPPSVRAAILARVVQQTVGGVETPLLDGRYRLLEEIGRGGAGTVWKAELRPLGRLVAVKLLRPSVGRHGNAVSRLMREAMTVSKLGHEHIVQVNDVGTDEHGSPYIAMELLEGEPLSQWVARRGPLPWSEVAEIATQLCDALRAAHAVGVVHRDIKPANIIAMKRDDGRWRCKLLDFGLCTAGRETPVLTAAGVLLGTPGYAAPEQIRGETVDGRADLYGLACVMVELLTGQPAFSGETRQEVVANQLDGRRATDLGSLDLPDAVVALLDRGLAVSAEDRHESPAAFATAILGAQRRVLGTALRSGEAPTGGVRRRAAVGSAVALAGAGVLALALALAPAPDTSVVATATAVQQPPVREPPDTPPALPPARAATEPAVKSASPAALPQASPTVVEPAPAPTRARAKRARRKVRKPTRPVETEAPAPQPTRTYPEGIRDPFAVR